MSPSEHQATHVPLNHDRAGALLRLGLSRARRGVDDVADRMRAANGPEWLGRTLRALPSGSPTEAEALLTGGRASLEQLQTWKENHKAAMTAPGSSDDRNAAILLYYLCVSAARTAHGATITGQPAADLSEALIDLAAAMPEPWSTLLARAGLAFGPAI